MGKTLLLVVLLGIALYALYLGGFMTLQSKRAVLYVGSLKGNSARFSSCTGYSKRILRFRESRPYLVDFNCSLTGGDVTAEILDSDKETVVSLPCGTQSASIAVQKGKRYYLVIRFRSATGSYTLGWR